MWKPRPRLPMNTEQRRTMEAWVRAKTSPQRVVLRSRICLLAAEGISNNGIAKAWDFASDRFALEGAI